MQHIRKHIHPHAVLINMHISVREESTEVRKQEEISLKSTAESNLSHLFYLL